jgi:hypothetical protein
MLRIASTECKYSWPVLLLYFFLSLFLGLIYTRTPTTIIYLYLPIFVFFSATLLLRIEGKEKHLRLFSALPFTRTQLALARLSRALIVPAVALTVGVALLLVSLIFPANPLTSLAAPWPLILILFASIASFFLLTLLYDIGGMTFLNVVGVTLAVIVIVAALSFSYLPPGRLASFVHLITHSPLGALLALALCVLLGAADIAVFSKRSRMR